MRVPTRRREFGLAFNITPLIDIIFLLIIFFLAASHLARSDASTPVDLPEATQDDESPERPLRRLVVTVGRDGALSVAGQPIDRDKFDELVLQERLDADGQPLEVRIRGDKHVRFESIEPLMKACVSAGITEVGFATIQK